MLLSLLTLQLRFEFAYLRLHKPLLLILLHENLFLKLRLRVHLVYLLARPIHFVLQPHVLVPHPVYLEVAVLDLLLHVLYFSVEVSLTTPCSPFPSHHV